MFEAQSRNRMGLLLWMSHPAWPSFVWQTTTTTSTHRRLLRQPEGLGAAAHPVEPAQRRRRGGELQRRRRARARGAGRGPGPRRVGPLARERPRRQRRGRRARTAPAGVPRPLSPVHFVRLKLARADGLVSENFYWRGVEEGTSGRSAPCRRYGSRSRLAPSGRATGSLSPPSFGTVRSARAHGAVAPVRPGAATGSCPRSGATTTWR